MPPIPTSAGLGAPPGPPPFATDPYARMLSPNGVPVDQLVSVLQKSIRRSEVDTAVLAAYEMHTTSPEVAAHLWRRLRLIAVEDVGQGAPLAPVLLRELQRDYEDSGGTDWMQVVHAVRHLATAPKDRTSSEQADYVRTAADAGVLHLQVPDHALCLHTRAGQLRGRDLLQWWRHGARVVPELDAADHRYRDALVDWCRRVLGRADADAQD
ncbi:AAA family ATPase [Kineococcus gynurae]|uniref:AAA family ATPase n=1 Tax=Kineococcus gynurae TaxID=452979 RepID=A0ABV5LVU7_9ACTN